jgi:hypothetical protein
MPICPAHALCVREQTEGAPCSNRSLTVIGHSSRPLGGIVYAYHQHCYEARDRTRKRRREAESERLRRECRARGQKRRRAAPLDLLIAYTRRATGLELDT